MNPSSLPLFQSSVPVLARAVTSWSATTDGHPERSPSSADTVTALLSLSQGDIVSVLQQREDWCLGQLKGTQGWFPKDRITLLTNSHIQYEHTHTHTVLKMTRLILLNYFLIPVWMV